MKQTDLDYYRRRLLAEEEAARHATHPQAVRCHRSMADHYARLVAAGVEDEADERELALEGHLGA